jgi:Flp pilus assembly protein protease CpaA
VIVTEIILIGLAGLFSYLSIFHPQVFSKNIQTLHSSLIKWILFALGFIGSVIWIFYSNPQTLSNSLVLLFELIFIQIGLLDSYSKVIPNKLIVILLLLTIIAFVGDIIPVPGWQTAGVLLIIAVLQFGVYLLKGSYAFGWGDVKLIFTLSLFYCSIIVQIVLGGIILGGMFAGGVLLIHSRHNRAKIPLAPFFLISMMVLSEFSLI